MRSLVPRLSFNIGGRVWVHDKEYEDCVHGCGSFFLLSLFSQTSVRTPSIATPTTLTVVKGSILSSAVSILSKHENLLYMSSEPIMT